MGACHGVYDRYWNLRIMYLLSGTGFKNHPAKWIGHPGLRTYLHTQVVSQRELYQELCPVSHYVCVRRVGKTAQVTGRVKCSAQNGVHCTWAAMLCTG